MGRLIVRYRDGAQILWGELQGNAPFHADDVVEIAPLVSNAETTQALIADKDGLSHSGSAIRIAAHQLLSPVTTDAAIYAQGLNYQAHASEVQHAKRHSNLIFSKASSSLTGPYADIVRPEEVQLLDYEVEFGIVLRCNLGESDRVDEGSLGDAVAGIVLCNDVSARDTQFGASFFQWFRGKSYRTFCPVGPVLWLLEPGEVSEALQSLEIKLWVNAELRQTATSDQLIFGPLETLNYIASTMDMKAGDLILTGTPGGVTAPATPRMVEILKEHLLADDLRRDELRIEMTKGRPFLQPGDMVSATLVDTRGRKLGGLNNKIADAK